MVAATRKIVVNFWKYVINNEVIPLRHIPDVAVRHCVLQILGCMWAISCSIASGSYTFMVPSITGHTILIAAAAITAATWATATNRSELLFLTRITKMLIVLFNNSLGMFLIKIRSVAHSIQSALRQYTFQLKITQ